MNGKPIIKSFYSSIFLECKVNKIIKYLPKYKMI